MPQKKESDGDVCMPLLSFKDSAAWATSAMAFMFALNRAAVDTGAMVHTPLAFWLVAIRI
jgi:hypothetical protein